MAYIFASGTHIRIYGGIFNAVNNTSGGTITIINRNTVQKWPASNGESPYPTTAESSARSDYPDDAAYETQESFDQATYTDQDESTHETAGIPSSTCAVADDSLFETSRPVKEDLLGTSEGHIELALRTQTAAEPRLLAKSDTNGYDGDGSEVPANGRPSETRSASEGFPEFCQDSERCTPQQYSMDGNDGQRYFLTSGTACPHNHPWAKYSSYPQVCDHDQGIP
ncbi:hypothetical protein D9619_002572 [Psilocybe cf. subviscida]|uniref:Uncharacterized protein n=1 Tax=Psilocybe cf. subviscida TaxID=2480587 RepID=A0A8H5AW46_9AGAR|nr:hypothetical protein D9619_002572 [Psilocybe cf. subviscida]